MPKVQRKRKWLNSDQASILSSKKQLTISTDTLKSYLPATPTIKDNVDENKQSEDISATKEPEENKAPVVNSRRVIDSSSEVKDMQTDENKPARTVIVEVLY